MLGLNVVCIQSTQNPSTNPVMAASTWFGVAQFLSVRTSGNPHNGRAEPMSCFLNQARFSYAQAAFRACAMWRTAWRSYGWYKCWLVNNKMFFFCADVGVWCENAPVASLFPLPAHSLATAAADGEESHFHPSSTFWGPELHNSHNTFTHVIDILWIFHSFSHKG